MKLDELAKVLKAHKLWLGDGTKGKRADLSRADLSGANLSEADLSGANLFGADLSEANGFFDGLTWAANAFETTVDGVVVYKVQSSNPMYSPPKDWKYIPGEVLTAIVNPLPTVACACGVNVATLEWCLKNYKDQKGCKLWKCLIRWPWLIETVVPYNTDGKIRCSRVELLEVVEEW